MKHRKTSAGRIVRPIHHALKNRMRFLSAGISAHDLANEIINEITCTVLTDEQVLTEY
jgi:hypothetical protein